LSLIVFLCEVSLKHGVVFSIKLNAATLLQARDQRCLYILAAKSSPRNSQSQDIDMADQTHQLESQSRQLTADHSQIQVQNTQRQDEAPHSGN
jgi:hypothetical protein